jgi:hypothetical protein
MSACVASLRRGGWPTPRRGPVPGPGCRHGPGHLYRVQVGWRLSAAPRTRLQSGPVSCQAVEPPVHRPLQASAWQVEQHRRRQRGGGHGHRRVETEHLGGQQDQSRIRHRQQSVISAYLILCRLRRDRSGNVTAQHDAPPRGHRSPAGPETIIRMSRHRARLPGKVRLQAQASA